MLQDFPLIQKHFNKLKSESDTISDVKKSLSIADDASEENVKDIEHVFFQTVSEDEKQELSSSFD